MPREEEDQRYTAEFKKQVIETMREEHLGHRETTERLHIRHEQVHDWERIYLTEGPEGFLVERRGRESKGRPRQLPKEAEEDLLAEVQRPRAENEYLKNLRVLILEDERRQRRKHRQFKS